MPRMQTDIAEIRGFTLVESIVTLGLISLCASLSLPALGRMRQRSQQTIAAQELKMLVQRGRMEALKRGVRVGIHFSKAGTGWTYCYYRDGNANGLLAADREKGIDPPIGSPQPLFRENPFTPRLTADAPPITGEALPDDPITLTGHTLTFSPTASFNNGTIYLGDGREALALRMQGSTGRVRVYSWHAGLQNWKEIIT
jgi:prepilin-type N-terminal cleavage/methylation domain-containing protein